MTFLRKILGWLFKGLAVLAVLFVIFFTSLVVLTRHERALAKDFIGLLGQHQFAQAHAMFAEEAQQAYPLHQLKAEFGAAQAYTGSWFSNIQIANGLKTIAGEMTTAEDCKSTVEFVFRDQLIVGFRVAGLCETGEHST